MEEAAALQGPYLPDDLRSVLANDPVAQKDWDELSPKQQSDWIRYLAEGREPARRDVRIANLLMGISHT